MESMGFSMISSMISSIQKWHSWGVQEEIRVLLTKPANWKSGKHDEEMIEMARPPSDSKNYSATKVGGSLSQKGAHFFFIPMELCLGKISMNYS